MLSDAFGALVVRAFGIVLMFVSTTLTARLLGPAEYGTWSAALALALLLATLAPLGTDRILVRNLSVAKSRAEAGRETALAHLCTAIVSVVLLSGCLGAWLMNVWVLGNVKWGQTSLLASILFLPLTVTYLRQWIAIPLIGTRRAVMPEQTFLPLAFTSVIALLAVAELPLTSLTAALIYAGIVLLVWIGSLGSRSIRHAYRAALRAGSVNQAGAVRERIREGIPFITVAVGAVLSQTCMPLTIAATCGFADTAHFALAVPYAALAAIPLGVFNLSMIPRCTRHYQNREFSQANHAVRSAATATFVLAGAISLGTIIVAPWVVLRLGPDFAPVCRLLPALLLAAMIDCLTGPTIPVMQTMGMERFYSCALLAYIPIQIGLIFVLGRYAGVEGAALAYLLARCFWNVVIVYGIFRIRGLLMLLYLRVSRAIRESSGGMPDSPPASVSQQFWNQVSVSDPAAGAVRAA